jgi:ATP-dependent RNA helicase RhlE
MSEETVKPVKKYYDNISVGQRTNQVIYFVEQHDKPVHLDLYMQETPSVKTVLLVKSKKTADSLATFLKEKNLNAVVTHGNHRAAQIEETLKAFHDGDVNLLVTTNAIFAAHEFSDVKRVINYDLPQECEQYFKSLRLVDEVGESVSFVSSAEEKMLDTLEYLMRHDIPRKEIDSFTHTAMPSESTSLKDKTKKPRHKKVALKAKIKAQKKAKWGPRLEEDAEA